MKKLFTLLVVLLFSAVGHAKYYKAVLYMQDGTNKTGLAELVDMEDSKVYFKSNEEAKTEKISSTDLTRIVYTYDTGQIVTMDYLYLTSENIFSKKISKSKKKKWFTILYSKDFKIGRIDDKGSHGPNNFRAASSSYFFEKNGSDQLVFGFNSLGSVTKSYGTDARIKKMAKETFVDCPKLIEAVEKETFTLDTALNQMITIFATTKCN